MKDKPNQLDYEPSTQRKSLPLAHWLAVVSVAVGALNIIWFSLWPTPLRRDFPGGF